MTTTFALRTAPTHEVLSIRETCLSNELGRTIGRLLPEVQSWAFAHGVRIVGSAFTRYSEWNSSCCTVDAGFVVEGLIETADPRVHCAALGGRSAVFGMHVGAYDTLAATYAAMGQWIQTQGYAPDEEMWEEYLDAPDLPAAEQRTEVWWPVHGA